MNTRVSECHLEDLTFLTKYATCRSACQYCSLFLTQEKYPCIIIRKLKKDNYIDNGNRSNYLTARQEAAKDLIIEMGRVDVLVEIAL